MNQVEVIRQKAALALSDSFYVELINRVRVLNSNSLVGIIKKFSEILGFENQLAASLRNAAILARDFPSEFINIKQGDKKVKNIIYDSSFLKNKWPFPFMWGDWKCLLEISEEQGGKYNPFVNPEEMNIAPIEEIATRLVGFKLKVSFSQARDLEEIKGKLIELSKISRKINIVGTQAEPWFGVESDHGALQSREDNIYNWFLVIKDLKEKAPDHRCKYAGWTLSSIYLSFSMNGGISNIGKLKEENFRLKFILICISNWLNIPVDLNF